MKHHVNWAKRCAAWGMLLLLLLCGCDTVVEEPSVPVAELPGVNVRDYGAVGDAVYHHPFGEMSTGTGFWVGHYSALVTDTFYAPYTGKEELNSTYTIVAGGSAQQGQVPLSEVRPGSKSYKLAVGDVVVAYEAADPDASVPATDDSDAFEAAIAAGDGYLYLPEGDYQISQLVAAEIVDISGPGRIWLKEWKGGSIANLKKGLTDALVHQNYGWIDEAHFHDDIWREMHWVTCYQDVNGWTDTSQFSGNVSPRMEYRFDSTRDNVNVWLTVQPAVPKEEFPDSITVCIADMSGNYSVKGSTEWYRATKGGVDGGLYDLSWNGTSDDLPESAWKDCGDWVEVTVRREDLFRTSSSGAVKRWALHCWSEKNISLKGKQVEYVCNTARVWVKEAEAVGCVMCDIGGDMRPHWKNKDEKVQIMEACDGTTQILTQTPRRFYAYTVPDAQFDVYAATFPS